MHNKLMFLFLLIANSILSQHALATEFEFININFKNSAQ